MRVGGGKEEKGVTVGEREEEGVREGEREEKGVRVGGEGGERLGADG